MSIYPYQALKLVHLNFLLFYCYLSICYRPISFIFVSNKPVDIMFLHECEAVTPWGISWKIRASKNFKGYNLLGLPGGSESAGTICSSVIWTTESKICNNVIHKSFPIEGVP